MDDKGLERSELIDRYLNGRLTETEMRHFKKQLKDDEALRKDHENSEISVEAIKNFGLRNELKSIRKAMHEEEATLSKSETRTISLFRYWPRVAAAILVILIGFLAIQMATLSGEDLYQEKALPFPTEIAASRGLNEAEEPQYQALQETYATENFAETIRQYELLQNPSTAATFIAGNAYLRLDQPEKAIVAFRKVLNANESQGVDRFQEDAEYYLAFSYLRKGDYDQARQIFKDIKASTSKYRPNIDNYFLFKLRMLDWID